MSAHDTDTPAGGPGRRGNPADPHRTAQVDQTVGDAAATRDAPSSQATFPAEAASLLRHLNLPVGDSTASQNRTPIPAQLDVAALPPPPPDVVIPDYEIVGELGRGGMGVVYKARQTKLNRLVALKTVFGGRVGEKSLARFLVEAEAAAAVEHANVVRVHDYGEVDGRPWMALEYLPGGTLADRLAVGGRMPPRDAAVMVAKIARGVAAAHSLGIVHRDLKPANVLFDETGEPKVADFGLAKRSSSDLTQTQAILGTPAYMAPEQAGGGTKFVAPPADVWALGVILYECLHGERPFQAGNVDLLLALIRSDEPAVLPSSSEIPRDLDRICRKCMEKHPADRYPSAAELVQDLERFARGEPVSVRPLGPVGRAVRWSRRNPVVAGLLATVVVVTVGLVVSLFSQYKQAEAQAASERQAKIDAEKLASTEASRRVEAERLQKLADAEAERANEVSDFMTGLFRASDPLDFFGDTLLPPNWEKQRTKTAEVLLREAAQKFRTELTGQPLTRAKLLSAVANSLTNLGDYKTAEPILREALDLRRANLPAEHPDVVKSELDLGRLHWHLGDFVKALALFRGGLESQRRGNAPESAILTARFYEALALAFIKPGEADPIFREVIEGRERLLGPNHRDTISARLGYAALLLDDNRTSDLLKLMPKLLGALKAQPDGQFREIVDAFASFQVGVGLAQQASSAPTQFLSDLVLKQAETRLREGLAKAEANMPADHMLVGLIRYELAGVLDELGKDDEADRLYDRVIVDLRKTVGLAHPKVLVLTRHVGDRMAKANRVADARKLWDDTEQANRDRFGSENHWRGVLLLSRVKFECRFGSLDSALTHAGHAVELLRQKKVMPTREAAQALLDAAKWLARPGLPEPTRALVRELFTLTKKFVGEVHGPQTREMCIALRVEGAELFLMGERTVGAAKLAEAARLGPQLKPDDDAERRDLMYWLGRLEETRGEFDEAAKHFAEARNLSRGHNWPRDRLTDARALVRALTGQGKYIDAARVQEEVRRLVIAGKTTDADTAWEDMCLASLRFAGGQTDDHRADVRAMLKRYEKATDANSLARLAWATGLGANATPDEARGVAKRLATALKPNPQFTWGHWALALVWLRAGDVDAAEAALRAGGPTWNSRPWAFHPIVSGLCALKRGDSATARTHLKRAEELIAREKPTERNPFAYADTNWADRLLSELLVSELRTALAAREVVPAPREIWRP